MPSTVPFVIGVALYLHLISSTTTITDSSVCYSGGGVARGDRPSAAVFCPFNVTFDALSLHSQVCTATFVIDGDTVDYGCTRIDRLDQWWCLEEDRLRCGRFTSKKTGEDVKWCCCQRALCNADLDVDGNTATSTWQHFIYELIEQWPYRLVLPASIGCSGGFCVTRLAVRRWLAARFLRR